MIARLFHYLILLPISLLPFKVLYFLSDILYLILYYIINYRKEIISKNIDNSFPDLNTKQKTHLIKQFYKHLSDIMVESVKSFTITKKQLYKRFTITNHEIIDAYAAKNRSVIIVGGHYNNWEMFAQATPLYHKHKCLGIYKELSNKFYNSKMLKSRQQFGFSMYSMNETLKCFKNNSIKAIFFASDQSPSNYKNVFWTHFLNQDTAVLSGVERLSKLYDYPIFSYHITKSRRGYYKAEYELLIDSPKTFKNGDITRIFTKKIQQMILENPQFWLWSHKRWKKNKQLNKI